MLSGICYVVVIAAAAAAIFVFDLFLLLPLLLLSLPVSGVNTTATIPTIRKCILSMLTTTIAISPVIAVFSVALIGIAAAAAAAAAAAVAAAAAIVSRLVSTSSLRTPNPN